MVLRLPTNVAHFKSHLQAMQCCQSHFIDSAAMHMVANTHDISVAVEAGKS